MSISTLLRGIVPGIAQIHRGRRARGLLLFFLFALSFNAWIIYPLVDDNTGLRVLCLALAILFWLISFLDAITHSPPAAAPAPVQEPPAP